MPSTVTKILRDWNDGDPSAPDRLVPLIYAEVRRLARAHLLRESSSALQPTELLHEAFLRIVANHSPAWRDRLHFFGVASRTMRRVLVDEARARKAAKRQPASLTVSVSQSMTGREEPVDIVALNRALDRLAGVDAAQARVVELRFFAGLTIEETAQVMGTSPMTVKREWLMAKAWLRREIGRADTVDGCV